MKQTCCICGGEDDELFMKRINTGRVRWMCAKCYRNANHEVTFSTGALKRRKIMREEKQKRR